MKAKQKSTAVDKISYKTLNKLLCEQATVDAETQAIKQQQRVYSKGARRSRTVGTNKDKHIPITQDDDKSDDTLAPTVLDLPGGDWGVDEEDQDTPPKLRRSPRLKRHYIPRRQTRSYKSYSEEWRLQRAP